ncbi:MAG: hypothetical protein M1838_004297 [Thelocarpon superellum]|nr:MAG: hypothetical protein M1838_004297 [Thelocarpon superellum]
MWCRALWCLLLVGCTTAATDYTQYVLPFLGTDGGGNMFPGPTMPFGVVKLGPDVGASVSGYSTTGTITGFSMMHESGTGGSPKYGVVSQMPVVGAVSNPLQDLSVRRPVHDVAQVGYYKSSLSSGVVVELAATDHTGMYQYTFPANQAANVVVDLSHRLTSGNDGLGQNFTSGNITVLADGHYEGSGTYNNGWNLAPDWTIYFCGVFDPPPTAIKTFHGTGTKLASYVVGNATSGSDRRGAVFTFANTTVTSNVGISWISSAKACQFVQDEAPTSASLTSLANATQDRWNTQVLSKITTTDTDPTNLNLLYSSLYGMHMMPSNRTGENPLWTSSEPYYDDLYTLWDLFRSHMPLMHILQPVAYEELLRSIIDVWRHEGFMPDGRSSNFNGKTEGGSNADTVLADAYVKGVRGQINWQDGYQAMVTDAEVTPPNNHDPRAPDSSTKEGRGALPDWRQLGYITTRFSRSVSRALEYAGNDFGLAQVAQGLGRASDAEKYLRSSRNWQNHWNPQVASLGFNGFLAPRDTSGAFASGFNPLSCSGAGGCYWRGAVFEALPWEYAFTTHHDMSTLVQLCGGPRRFVQKLDTIFTPMVNPSGNPQFEQTIIDPGNEPDFASPYLFNFAGRQDLSVKRSRFIAKTYYSTGTSGLPGNSDAGAMQSWLLWNMIGLYPLTGQTTFLIGSPWLGNMTIDLGASKQLVITSTGGNSDTAYYVQRLQVNGQAWNQSWLVWNDVFAQGGRMDFVLGSQPANWTTGAPPPSPAAGPLTPVAPPPSTDDRRRKIEAAAFASVGCLLLTLLVGVGLYLWLRPWRRNRRSIGGEGEDAAGVDEQGIASTVGDAPLEMNRGKDAETDTNGASEAPEAPENQASEEPEDMAPEKLGDVDAKV